MNPVTTKASLDSTEAGATRTTRFIDVTASLSDMIGKEQAAAVCKARAFLTGDDLRVMEDTCDETVEFYPRAYHDRLIELLPLVGATCVHDGETSASGATSSAVLNATKLSLAPRSCMGYLRMGEDGRLCLSSKSAHYHTPLGHDFPGYALIERARQLGIPNAVHNNTRGHITRLTEHHLVRVAAGLAPDDEAGLRRVLTSEDPYELNRVLNLETGSLAVEAALKMVLARFYTVQGNGASAPYAGRTPVILVIGDDEGSVQGNYHGTTLITQLMRGMWPGFLQALDTAGLFQVRAVRPNRIEDLEAAFQEYETGRYKVAGVFHELIMMNYAARLLSPAFVERMYALCEAHDAPAIVDEIQTCIWSPEILMFREYGVRPAIAVVGKGFPGGEYAASRVLFCKAMDNLPQFGALITNGQAELSSLAYLITLRWAEANAGVTRSIGEYYEEELRRLAAHYPALISAIEGKRHLAGIFFRDLEPAQRFVGILQDGGFDISVQAYKPDCPPCALTKLPLTMGYEAVDFTIARFEDALSQL